ncbi:ATP-binding protein [Pseudogemmobacter sp. W21_MBD1_M6]|uniref:ATP-binding protein n=1 Tax=Pseudogemmobacter sp. W21_MBD1_M6 TaxID=3240271 RepID=UPI003F9D13B4
MNLFKNYSFGGIAFFSLQGGTAAHAFTLTPTQFHSTLSSLAVSTTTLFGLGLWSLMRSRADRRSLSTQHSKLAHEVAALNSHAIVTLTDTDARITYANEKFTEATGYAPGELIGQSADVLYPKDENERFVHIRQELEKGNTWSGETRILRRDGGTIWTRATIMPRLGDGGVFLGAISVRTDITSTKMDAAQRDVSMMLDKLSDEIYIFDLVTLRYTYMNEAAMKRHGHDCQTYLQKTFVDDVPDLDADEFRAKIATLVDDKVERFQGSISVWGVPFDISLQLIRPELGDMRCVAVLRDVSERIAIERTKDEFIATVSHELRSPLTSIKGAMGLLLSGAAGDLTDKSRKMLEIAHRNADRLVLIINDILDLEKIAAGQMEFRMEANDLVSVVNEAVIANQQFADRFDVRIVTKGLQGTARATFDPDRILQVLNNLLSNAAKFSNPGGEVHVIVETLDDRYRVTVQDFGDGIPKEAQSKIFERFTQAENNDRRAAGGTGLGLSIAKAIVESHGGQIAFESEDGHGTKFYFELPLLLEGVASGSSRAA